jgi:acetylornithine deacetylase/succinyl-diaminopimelate desuccinylase-like protein
MKQDDWHHHKVPEQIHSKTISDLMIKGVPMEDWTSYLDKNRSRFLDELKAFLKIPSISSLPEHAKDVRQAAQWVADRLAKAGIEKIKVLETGGHPVVYGQWLHAPGQPTVMIYGHFDVQPVDPIEHWSQPPFEPTLKKDRIFARGASDDKGNMLIPILAVEALLQSQGRLPVNVKFFFEGQEEIGSPQLPDFISKHKELLACDLILSADGGQWAADQPALTVGRRGLCALQLDVKGPDRDVHSGTYGGAIRNPIQALAQLITSFHGPDGSIKVKGFYNQVRPMDHTVRNDIDAIPYDEAEYKKALGVHALWGEAGYSPYERTWVRPTLEINGVYGGFQGEGIKTIIPSQAHAKITCRLVPDQQPDTIVEQVMDHVKQQAPAGVQVTIALIPGQADPFQMPGDHPGNQAARTVLKALYGKEPHVAHMGGTIPVCGLFLKHLGAYMVSFGFGLKDERIHSPDEFFRLESFERGQKAYAMILETLGH